MHQNFVHLHLHSQYSLLDGAIRLDDLLRKVKEHGMPAVALTDHGAMFGAIEFYQKCKDKGIRPVIGCEVYIAPGSRFVKESGGNPRSEERRVGKECRSRWWPYH